DGIRDFHVTGVQTCALPISVRVHAIIDVAATSIEARTCDYGRESGNSRALGGFGDLWGPAGPGTGGGDEEGEGGGAAGGGDDEDERDAAEGDEGAAGEGAGEGGDHARRLEGGGVAREVVAGSELQEQVERGE